MIKACPSHDQLLQLLAENLPHSELETVAEHVQLCGACQQSLEVLVSRNRPDSSSSGEPKADEDLQFLTALKKLGPGYGDNEPEETLMRLGDPPLPARIGDYDLLSRLGAGGTAVVYKARDRRLGRIVAVKLIQPQANARPEIRTRFRREATAVARLQHPELVHVFEIGEHEGQLFLVMEYVDSGTLADYLHGIPQPPRETAAFVERIARAVAYAHEQGIVHRDLKPANILLASQPQSSTASERQQQSLAGRRLPLEAFQPKVADFGLAKTLDEDVDLTRSNAVLGTPTYLAPEQIRESSASGPSCDIYALGVLLYEMLCGRLPLVGPTILATLRLVAGAEPMPPRRLEPQVPRALETICLKCLAKDPARRYATVLELAEDLRRFCEGRPIRARRVGWSERTWLWSRRNPLVAGLTACLVATLVAGGYALVLLMIRINRHAAEAEAQAQRANEHAYVSDMRLLPRAWDDHQIGLMRELLNEHRPEHRGDMDRRGFEWYFWNQLGHLEDRTLAGHQGWLNAVCYRPDGRLLASASDDGTVRIWVADTGALERTIEGGERVFDVCYSPDGKLLAGCGTAKTVMIWDAATGRSVAKLAGHTQWVSSVCFSPGGRRLASASRDGTVRVWDFAKYSSVLELEHKNGVNRVCYSPDGHYLATAVRDGTIRIWDAKTGEKQKTLTVSNAEPKCLAFRPDGKQLACGADDGQITFWELPGGHKQGAVPIHTGWVTGVCYSPDANFLLSTSADRTLRVLDVSTRRERSMLQGHTEWISSGCFSPDGNFIASASHDGMIKIWNPRRSQGTLQMQSSCGPVARCCFSPDSKTLAVACGPSVQLWTEATTDPHPWATDGSTIACLSFSTDGKRLATGSQDGNLRIWTVSSGAQEAQISLPKETLVEVRFTPEGQSLASVTAEGHASVWDLRGEKPKQGPVCNVGPLTAASLSPLGGRVAVVNEQGVLRVWDLTTGKVRCQCQAHKLAATVVAYSPDGRLVATGSADKTVRVWDAGSGRLRLTLSGHMHAIRAIAFSADGKRIVTAGADKMVKLWTADTGQELAAVKSTAAAPMSVAFSADGTLLATSAGSDVKVWRAPRPADD